MNMTGEPVAGLADIVERGETVAWQWRYVGEGDHEWKTPSGGKKITAEELKRERPIEQRPLYTRTPSHGQPAPVAEGLEALLLLPVEAINALESHQRQIDRDGVEVGVSRQAVDEIVAAVKKARAALSRPVEHHPREQADDLRRR